ncbi:MFS transporter [Hoeflea sp.]|uniref:MFS transporter n=1 Tax=Hoeflea sp. TaxID=1940281 RepID=UPI0025BA5B1D|nr:MFS transporter [Hoeflea sp.]
MITAAVQARTRYALFAAGFTTFSLLYYVQALLPIFSDEFGVEPSQSSLALSLTTGVLAFALLASGAVSDAVGRKSIMFLSLFLSSALSIAMAFSPNWTMLLGIRVAMGITLCGVQSVAMAYMSEELDSKAFSATLGLFIGGSAIGGMVGRFAASVIADHYGWRTAVAIIGLAGLCAALYFRYALPASRNFVPRARGGARLKQDLAAILADKSLLCLFVVGFAVMSGFVTTYNYISYRLVAAPFFLSQTAIGFVFAVYFFGSIGAAFAGRRVGSHGHSRLLWRFQAVMITGILLTLSGALAVILLGLALLTFGMFASHSIASSWVSLKAHRSKALAVSLYLFSYYQGGSLIGAVGGMFYLGSGWGGLVALTTALGLLGVLCGLSVGRGAKS